MTRTRLVLTAAATTAALLLLPTTAWAGDVQHEELDDPVTAPWEVMGWGGEEHATFRDGRLTLGSETLVMLREHAGEADWTGSANRLTGYVVETRMRLGSDATGAVPRR